MSEDSSKSPKILILFGVFFLYLAYSQISKWGEHTPAIFKAKFAMFWGAASTADYQRLGEACVAIKNPECALEALTEVYRAQRDPEVIAPIARTFLSVKDYKAAEHYYVLYFKAGGRSQEESFYYAQALEQLGLKDRALRAYQFSLKNRKLSTTRDAAAAVKRLSHRRAPATKSRKVAVNRKK